MYNFGVSNVVSKRNCIRNICVINNIWSAGVLKVGQQGQLLKVGHAIILFQHLHTYTMIHVVYMLHIITNLIEKSLQNLENSKKLD